MVEDKSAYVQLCNLGEDEIDEIEISRNISRPTAARQAIIIPSSYDGLWRIISTARHLAIDGEKLACRPSFLKGCGRW